MKNLKLWGRLKNPKILFLVTLALLPLPIFTSYLAQLHFVFTSALLFLQFLLNIRLKAQNLARIRYELENEFYQFKDLPDYALLIDTSSDVKELKRLHLKVYFCCLSFSYILHTFQMEFILMCVMYFIIYKTCCVTFQVNISDLKYFEKHGTYNSGDYMLIDLHPFLILFYLSYLNLIGVFSLSSSNFIALTVGILSSLWFGFISYRHWVPQNYYDYSFLREIYINKELEKGIITHQITEGEMQNPPNPQITSPTQTFHSNEPKPKLPY